MAVDNHRFTVLVRNFPPNQEGRPVTKRKKISKGLSELSEMDIREYNKEKGEVEKGKVEREEVKVRPGTTVQDTLHGAIFSWDILINGEWINLIEKITLKELSVIPDSVAPTLELSLKTLSKWNDRTECVEVYIPMLSFIAMMEKTKLNEILDLEWFIGMYDAGVSLALDTWFGTIGNQPEGW